MFSAKQGNYWYHFYNVLYDTVLDWGLNPGPPALNASTLPLGYQEAVLDWGLNPGHPALNASTLPLGYQEAVITH